MIFTGTDKSLLDRAARMVDAQAKALHWDLLVDLRLRRSAKLEFDRLTRDARDLRALGKRIGGLVVKVAKPLTAGETVFNRRNGERRVDLGRARLPVGDDERRMADRDRRATVL